MKVDEFEQQLEKIDFFEGYTEPAKISAITDLRTNFAEGMEGENREHFEKYPGLSLCFFQLDGELDGADDLTFVVEQMATSSFGMFSPQNVTADDDGETLNLEFSVDREQYSVSAESGGWMPDEVLECIFSAMKKHCHQNYYNSIFYPNPGQTAFFTLCSDRAMKALVESKLVPAEYGDVPDGF